MIYYVVLLLIVILSIHYDINGKTKYRDDWYTALIIILIVIAGLRFRLGEDTISYINSFYHDTPDLWNLRTDDFLTSGSPPLWILLNSFIKTLGGRFYVVQFVQATILNVLLLKYFKKHSPYPFACVALYFFWRYQWFSMVVMKAAIALSIILFANDYILERKYKKGLMLILIATGFHQSSLLLVITPFLTFLRFNRIGCIILVSTYFVGAILQSKLGDVFELFETAEGVSNKLDSYMASDNMSQNHNLNYFILHIFPLIIYPILSISYLKWNCKDSKVFRLEPFLMIALIFQVMQFHIHIFYRYIYTYTPYYIIFIVYFLMEFSKRSFLLSKPLAYLRSFAVVFPLLFSFAFVHPLTYVDFYPYSSIFERSIDKERENYYSEIKLDYYLNLNEY